MRDKNTKSAKKSTNLMRTPFYQMSDSIVSLRDAVQDMNDPELKAMVNQMDAISNKMYIHLNTFYLWD